MQNSVVELIGGVLVPQIWEPLVGRPHLVPRERVQNRTPVQVVGVPAPQIMEAVLLFPLERVQNRTPEQIVGVLVTQIMEDGLPIVPQEREQNRVPEQIVGFPVPQIIEECVQNRTQVQIADSFVPQFMEAAVENRVGEQIVDSVPRVMDAVVEVVPPTLQKHVQNRPRKLFVDLPVPLITEIMACVFGLPQERVQNRASYTGKVFTVEMPHQHVHRANPCDSVMFNIKGLDKHNMPRFGDVMVPPSQITKISWFDGKSQAAANEPLYRFQPKRPGRSSRAKLKRRACALSAEWGWTCPFSCSSVLGSLQFFDRGRCCLGCSLELADVIS